MNNNIEIAFCWVFKHSSPEEGLPRLKSYGYDSIELWPDALNTFGVDRWATALAKNGMRCAQLCPYFDFVHGNEKIEASRQMLSDYVRMALPLGCRRIRVFTGPPWGEGVVGASEADENQWRSAIASLKEFCDVALGANIELCLECHEGSLMEDSPSALRLLEGVDRPNLTVNLQLPLVHEDWTVSVARLGSKTTHMHVHNWADGVGQGKLTCLADGVFDWRKAVALLEHRPLCLSVEHANHGGIDDPWVTAENDGAYLQGLRTAA